MMGRRQDGQVGHLMTYREESLASYADVIFTGGPIYSGEGGRGGGRGMRRLSRAATTSRAPADCVAVTGGRIAAVGTAGDARMTELRGPATEVIDLAGRAL